MYSVIIPAKNEAENITRCIRSVFNCVKDRRTVEIIVVDNGSSDNTKEIAEAEGARVFVKEDVNISELRNFGARNASYHILGFIDADCEALPGWLENAKNVLSDPTIGVVGDYCRVPKQSSWLENFYISSNVRTRREVSYLGSANMVIRKEKFLEVGGFDGKTKTGEDYVLCLKLKTAGLKVILDSSISVIHYGYPKTLMELYKREVWHGLGMLDLYKYGKLTLPLIWSLMNIILIPFTCGVLVLGHLDMALYLTILILLLPGGAALTRCRRNKSYNHCLSLYIIFAVYGFARTVSIFKRLKAELKPF